ncbi:MAG: hypothetical protein KF690_11940, partial [Bacteroidetes bacterium]|nr:hypothetical protein [Bacteroidota bacterium]
YGSAIGASTINYGVYAEASGATTNYAGYFVGNTYVSDFLGIGTTNPTHRLEVTGTSPTMNYNGHATFIHNANNGNAVFAESNSSGIFGGGTAYTRAMIAGYNPTPFGNMNTGVWGIITGSGAGGYGVMASYGASYTAPTTSAALAGNTYAGYFNGNTHINGILSKSGGTFKIDHPDDPANKYLIHSFVESPDMMNIYNGNVTTNASGEAWVELPDYFHTLNKDFRYQLTVVGTFAQAIIGQKVENGRFLIRTNEPNVEVSWQVTGIRKDPWAEQHPVVPVMEKPAEEKGKYLNPELYNQPYTKNVSYIDSDPQGQGTTQEFKSVKADIQNVPPRPEPTHPREH